MLMFDRRFEQLYADLTMEERTKLRKEIKFPILVGPNNFRDICGQVGFDTLHRLPVYAPYTCFSAEMVLGDVSVLHIVLSSSSFDDLLLEKQFSSCRTSETYDLSKNCHSKPIDQWIRSDTYVHHSRMSLSNFGTVVTSVSDSFRSPTPVYMMSEGVAERVNRGMLSKDDVLHLAFEWNDWFLWLYALLASGVTKSEPVDPTKLEKKKAQRGRRATPQSYKVVRLTKQGQRITSESNLTGKSKAAHIVRSHPRVLRHERYGKPRTIWVKGHIRGSGDVDNRPTKIVK